MALRIMTNPMSLNAQRHLSKSTSNVNETLEKLSSGSRINKAADDAAGLAISDALHADIRSLNQGIRNAQDGISLVQIYEGGTAEIANMVTRIRELAMAAATDTNGEREREMINNEAQSLIEEVERIANVTEFNGVPLLNGQSVELDFQIGKGNDDTVDRIRFEPGFVDMTSGGLDIDGIDLTDQDDARDALETVDEALFRVSEVRSRVGAAQSRLVSAIDAQKVFVENQEAARSRIRDTDFAASTAQLTQHSIIQQAGASVLAQANQIPALALQLLK